jgi:hypothetical protein
VADDDKPPNGRRVDRRGGVAIDPTRNVLDLVDAERRYQDGMRQAYKEITDAKSLCIEQIANLRSAHAEKVADAESRRVDEQAAMRAEYGEKLRFAEASRIDAIRAVDVGAVAIASQRASDQANVLQTQVATTAETIRNLVASTAAAAAISLQQQLGPISTRITTLEQAQYKGEGRSALADPAFSELLAEVKRLGAERNVSTGVGQGISTSWAVFIGIAMLIATILGVVGFNLSRNPAPPIQPTVQYVPAPTVVPPAMAPAPITVPR